jgi:type IV pilus assembly protein PilX
MDNLPTRREMHLAANSGKGRCLSAGNRRQRGAALILSMVILLILTILGISAMGTASLEEKMSGNTQEATRAFQAAESGLNDALNVPGGLDLNSGTAGKNLPQFTYDSGKSGYADVNVKFIQFSNPKRGSGYGNNFEAANFNQSSTGSTNTGAKATIHQGVAQIVPKSN